MGKREKYRNLNGLRIKVLDVKDWLPSCQGPVGYNPHVTQYQYKFEA